MAFSKTSRFINNAIGGGDDSIIVDDEFISKMKLVLTGVDVSSNAADKVLSPFSGDFFGETLTPAEIRRCLYSSMYKMIAGYAHPIDILNDVKPQVIVVCGINGVGKTTTIGKMTSFLHKYGWYVTVASCDCTRDAATEQLQELTKETCMNIVSVDEKNKTPIEVARAGYESAKQNESDLLVIDTAGRLQNNAKLMEEFSEFVLSVSSFGENVPHNIVLVVDASNGQVARSQIRSFMSVAKVTGLVFTKMDNISRAGIVLSIINEFSLPVHAIGIGTGIEDLQEFKADEFVSSIVGI